MRRVLSLRITKGVFEKVPKDRHQQEQYGGVIDGGGLGGGEAQLQMLVQKAGNHPHQEGEDKQIEGEKDPAHPLFLHGELRPPGCFLPYPSFHFRSHSFISSLARSTTGAGTSASIATSMP